MDELIDEINKNHIKIVNKITDLQNKIQLMENSKDIYIQQNVKLSAQEIETERQRLIDENNSLKVEVNELVNTLNALEAKRKTNSGLVLNTFDDNSSTAINGSKSEEKESVVEPVVEPVVESVVETVVKPVIEENQRQGKSEKKQKPKKEAKVTTNSDDNKPVDVSRIDLRVGRILSAERHADADSLYVEQIDCGEEKPRTVVSGLVRFVPLEEMQNRLVVVMCNLKPAKMRGITSEAMVMCASTPELVEILDPPEGSTPGDRVTFDKYPGTADPQLNPKKKIWEQVAPDLKTDAQCIATYKGDPFLVGSKGVVKSKTLANVQVK